MELREKGSNESDRRVFVGEDPDHAFPSSDLFIQSFLGIRASEPDTILPGKGQNRERFLKSFVETLHRLGSFLLKGDHDLVLDSSGFLFRVRPEQPSQGPGPEALVGRPAHDPECSGESAPDIVASGLPENVSERLF